MKAETKIVSSAIWIPVAFTWELIAYVKHVLHSVVPGCTACPACGEPFFATQVQLRSMAVTAGKTMYP